MIVEGALCIKASCVLVEASRVPGEGEEEVLLMRGRTAEEVLSEGCKKGATVDQRYRDRLMSLPQHLARSASRCACSCTASSA